MADLFVGKILDNFVMQWLRKPTNENPTHVASPTLYKNISLLSIVGHGGMGKTTLLQHIYEDLKEEFELKMWVCVSNDFDAKKVIANMLECLNKERPHLESLAAVQESLKVVVQSKRFLLVLDDIWEEDMGKWENVLCPLVYGGLGSKILLTTRLDTVASAIARVISKDKEIYPLNGLEEDVCLKLLNNHAFAGVKNLGAHTKLTDIASSIVKKLSGSPLAAKVIGGVLNSKLNESFWLKVLESNVVIVEPEPSRNNILLILKLSFTFLPQPLQNCFAFCGVFPQDHEFNKDDLVRIWIALGFIQESSIEGETLEDIGGRYFDVLVRKSFFDEFHDYKRIYYKMHDLLHDLAESISSEECFGFVGDDVLSFKLPKNVRHLFVKTENPEVLRMIIDVKNLHSLFLTVDYQDLTEILIEIFGASRRIRLLFICSRRTKKISEAIKNLRHLRYLNHDGYLTQMPRSLSSLYHLQFIICRNRGVPSEVLLPYDVSNLSNLRRLELHHKVFSSVPGIGKLRSLQELNEFNVKNENGYRIGELEQMRELRKLKIHFLENVKDAIEACNAKLFEKRKLTDLFLNWGNTVDEKFGSIKVPQLQQLLHIPGSLKQLFLNHLESLQCLPSSLPAISSLKHLELESIPLLKSLPELPPSLFRLYIESLKLECLPSSLSAISSLKFVDLAYIPLVKSLPELPPCLSSLAICSLDNLECLPSSLSAISSLMELHLEIIPLLKSLPDLPPSLSCMFITSLDKLECLPSSLSAISSLQLLNLDSIPLLKSLPEPPPSLCELYIKSLDKLECLPSSLSAISSLMLLELESIPLLKSLPELPPSLPRLSIKSLDNLECLPSSLSAISSLKHLELDSIPLLKSLPDLPSSCSIKVTNCDPELMKRY
ncbi:putative disease resistance protein RGA3 [Phalaenopsis equestris]|uniref:putative disease resistance protein RGA3 n=1 Tax=Phalaenopsis equestris TaxID=78828 RepID=UPI0009E2BFE4|nr:putative disease resistance protein RGA3 [Phalaenopsis equestris]